MQFAVAIAPLLAVASASPLVARAADLSNQVLANLTTVSSDATTLNNTVNAQPAGNNAYTTDQLIAIVNANNQLANDINGTSATANASSVWTQTESNNIYNKVVNELKPKTFSLLDNIVAHYPNFNGAGLTSTVKSVLSNDRELVRELGSALTAKAVDPAKSNSPAQVSAILSKFDNAIQKYSS